MINFVPPSVKGLILYFNDVFKVCGLGDSNCPALFVTIPKAGDVSRSHTPVYFLEKVDGIEFPLIN